MKQDEKYWTQVVVTLALGLGLLARWNPDSRREAGSRGFPDVVAAGPAGVLFAELKMAGGETSADQDLWAWTLDKAATASGGFYGLRKPRVFTVPRDYEDGTIERELRELLDS